MDRELRRCLEVTCTGGFERFASEHWSQRYSGLPPDWLRGLARRHGSLAVRDPRNGSAAGGLGSALRRRPDRGGDRLLVEREWATTAEDVLFRRTKAGLRMTDGERGRGGALSQSAGRRRVTCRQRGSLRRER